MSTTGKKLTDNPKDRVINVRLDAVTAAMLDTLAAGGTAKSQIIRDGIRLQFDQHEKKKRQGRA